MGCLLSLSRPDPATDAAQTYTQVTQPTEYATNCLVCHERLTESKVLPCGHIFCIQCLAVEVMRGCGTIRCPLDGQTCEVPADGVDGLPNHEPQCYASTALGCPLAPSPSTRSFDAKFKQPAGVAVSYVNDVVFVTDEVGNRFEIFKHSGSHIRSVGRYSPFKRFNAPSGVACTREGHVVVCDMQNRRVQIIDRAGGVRRMIGQADGGGPFYAPRDAAVDINSGDIYVTDSAINDVFKITENGGMVQKMGWRFSFPAGIAVTQGQVIVADSYNDRYRIFRTDGIHASEIQSPEVSRPFGLAVNAPGNTLYGCCEAGIAVFQLRPVKRLLKIIPSPVPGKLTRWIALLSEYDALVTCLDSHLVHRVRLNENNVL